MLKSVAEAVQALAILRAAEAHEAVGNDDESLPMAEIKAAIARAHEQFVQAAYAIAFDLVPKLHARGEITSQHNVRYSATPAGGGFVVVKMNLDPKNPGTMLEPGSAPINTWLQLMIDLPELLETLEVK